MRIRRNPAAWSRGEARRTSNAVTNEEAAICREEQSGADFGPDFLNEVPLRHRLNPFLYCGTVNWYCYLLHPLLYLYNV